MELRQYQKEASDAIIAEWNRGTKKTLLVLPTGCGKTICFSDVINRRTQDGSKALVLAHRGELLDQAADKIKKITGLDSAYEKAALSALDSNLNVTVASVQSLSQDNRLNSYPSDYYSTIVVDEAHHCLADTYQKVLKHFPRANVLGVTATPDRGDKQSLGKFFDSQAYEYTLRQAIDENYLCPIVAKLIPLELDISKVSISNGDFSVGEIHNSLENQLDQIARIIATEYSDRKTLIFLPLVKTSQKMKAALIRHGIQAEEVNGQSKNRAEILKDFEEGKIKVLCNSMLLTEGWDCPSVDCVVVLRPTRIRSLYCQMIGRGTRLHPGKKELLLLDFLWLSGIHELCHPSSLIANTEEEARMMNQVVKDNPDGINILSAETTAIGMLEAQREAALAKRLERLRHGKSVLVDPLQFFASIQDYKSIDYVPVFNWERDRPTDKQLKAIQRYGINTDNIKWKGEANRILSRLIKRADKSMSTPKQIRCLEKFGFEHVGRWKFDDASNMIDRIAKNKWQIPYDVRVSDYNRKYRTF